MLPIIPHSAVMTLGSQSDLDTCDEVARDYMRAFILPSKRFDILITIPDNRRFDSRSRKPQPQPLYLPQEYSNSIGGKSEMDLNYAKWDKVVEEVSQGCFCYL